MSYIIIEDSELAKRNKTFLLGCNNGIAYNAVVSRPVFSSESATEPVTLQEAKDWCRIDVTDDDVIIAMLIKAARIVCENYANLSFITRTISVRIMNGLGWQELPYGPVIAITAATDFYLNDIFTDFSLDTAYGNPINVTYTAGYATLPENLKNALLCQIAWMYENRGSEMRNTGVSELSKLILNQVRSV